MKIATSRKSYLENQTSWKYFMREWNKGTKGIFMQGTKSFQELLLIEILKELQFLNSLRS